MIAQFVLTILSSFLLLHDFHVTHTTLYYNSEKESLEITVRVAVEDLEYALEHQGAKNLRLGTANENALANEFINAYFKKHLKILPNGTEMDYEWIGKELGKDLHDLYLYFEVPNCNSSGRIELLSLVNSIFTEVLHDQSNILLVDFEGIKHNLTFSKDKPKQTVDIAQ